VTIGNHPPRIQDIIPDHNSPRQVLIQAGRTTESTSMHSGIESMQSEVGEVPDFASGRGGDGIGGVGLPTSAPVGALDQTATRAEEERQLLEKLGRILGWYVGSFSPHVRPSLTLSALCPTDHGQSPLLHHPITLPCGHTLSSSHITIPAPAPLRLDPSLPAHEIHSLQQRQHQQRLNLWAGVMCPIPTCKRYSPHVSTTPVVDSASFGVSPPPSTSSGAQRGEMLASGVTYYPPPLAAPPAYSADPPVTETGSPLLDISVDKILGLVADELKKARDDERARFRTATEVETDSDESDEEGSEPHGQSGLPANLSHLVHSQDQVINPSGLSSPLARQSSKRRKNTLQTPIRRQRPDSPGEWPFKKELLSVVECDVCAMMLHEPVTTPCQHVSYSSTTHR
jgi:hypothetical protein